MKYEGETEAGLEKIAKQLMADLDSQDETAQVVALQGELGAGKTTFVQKLAQVLGVDDIIQSPTYVIERVYLLPDEAPFRKLIHVDAYRLDESKELLDLGWQEKLANPHNLIVLEWPERVEGILPDEYHRLNFSVTGEETRDISITEVEE